MTLMSGIFLTGAITLVAIAIICSTVTQGVLANAGAIGAAKWLGG
jgi:hypothetical protein